MNVFFMPLEGGSPCVTCLLPEMFLGQFFSYEELAADSRSVSLSRSLGCLSWKSGEGEVKQLILLQGLESKVFVKGQIQ